MIPTGCRTFEGLTPDTAGNVVICPIFNAIPGNSAPFHQVLVLVSITLKDSSHSMARDVEHAMEGPMGTVSSAAGVGNSSSKILRYIYPCSQAFTWRTIGPLLEFRLISTGLTRREDTTVSKPKPYTGRVSSGYSTSFVAGGSRGKRFLRCANWSSVT